MTFTKPFGLSFWEAIKGQITTYLCLVNHGSHTYFVWNDSYNTPGNTAHSLTLFGVLMKYADMKLTVPLRKEKHECQHFPELTSHFCRTCVNNPWPTQALNGMYGEKIQQCFVGTHVLDICESSNKSFCIIWSVKLLSLFIHKKKINDIFTCSQIPQTLKFSYLIGKPQN